MRFALLAFTTRMVSGYNRGGVTIHAPSGDGNLTFMINAPFNFRYNPRPVRGRKQRLLTHPYQLRQVTTHAPSGDGKVSKTLEPYGVKLQPTPRQGTETLLQNKLIFRKDKVTTHAPSGDGNVAGEPI